MMYHFVAYKPSSSQDRCSRGCCGHDDFDSDFLMVKNITIEDVENRVTQFLWHKGKDDNAEYEFTLLPTRYDETNEEALQTAEKEMERVVESAKARVKAATEELARVTTERKAKEAEDKRNREKIESDQREVEEFKRLSQKFGVRL